MNYGHPLQFGTFITPVASQPETAVALAQRSEQLGYGLVTFQDHPYQPALLDAWTLLSWIAGRTEHIRLAANVLNLPLRPPAVLARAASSLDLLSGGRLDLALGAGAFRDAIAAMGRPRLAPAQAVAALGEAIDLIRGPWEVGDESSLHFSGEHYRLDGAQPGPVPAHDIPIWIGAYKPRMLRLIGRAPDGWLPSLAYLPGGPSDLADMNAHIDEGALAAGRDPSAVRRLLNISGQFASSRRGFLAGSPAQWAAELAELALEHGISAFILATDDAATIEAFAIEVAPATREFVAASRAGLAPGLSPLAAPL